MGDPVALDDVGAQLGNRHLQVGFGHQVGTDERVSDGVIDLTPPQV